MLKFDLEGAVAQAQLFGFTEKKDGFVELVQTEVTYLNSLSTLNREVEINDSHIKACLKAYEQLGNEEVEKEGYVNKEQFEKLLIIAAQLHEQHAKIYNLLLDKSEKEDKLSEIVKLYKALNELYVQYASYIGNGRFPPAVEKASAEFIHAQKAKGEGTHLQQINSILIQPVQRPPRYNMLTEVMLKNVKGANISPESSLYKAAESFTTIAKKVADEINQGKADFEARTEQVKLVNFAKALAKEPTAQNIQTFANFLATAPLELFDKAKIETALSELEKIDLSTIKRKDMSHFLASIQRLYTQVNGCEDIITKAEESIKTAEVEIEKAKKRNDSKTVSEREKQIAESNKTIAKNKIMKTVKSTVQGIFTKKVTTEKIKHANENILSAIEKAGKKVDAKSKTKKGDAKKLNEEMSVFYRAFLNVCKDQMTKNPTVPIDVKQALEDTHKQLMALHLSSEVFVTSNGFTADFKKLVQKMNEFVAMRFDEGDLNRTLKREEGKQKIVARETAAEHKSLLDIIKSAIQSRISKMSKGGLGQDPQYKLLSDFYHFAETQSKSQPWADIDITNTLMETYKHDKANFKQALGIKDGQMDPKSIMFKTLQTMGMEKGAILSIPGMIKDLEEEVQRKAQAEKSSEPEQVSSPPLQSQVEQVGESEPTVAPPVNILPTTPLPQQSVPISTSEEVKPQQPILGPTSLQEKIKKQIEATPSPTVSVTPSVSSDRNTALPPQKSPSPQKKSPPAKPPGWPEQLGPTIAERKKAFETPQDKKTEISKKEDPTTRPRDSKRFTGLSPEQIMEQRRKASEGEPLVQPNQEPKVDSSVRTRLGSKNSK